MTETGYALLTGLLFGALAVWAVTYWLVERGKKRAVIIARGYLSDMKLEIGDMEKKWGEAVESAEYALAELRALNPPEEVILPFAGEFAAEAGAYDRLKVLFDSLETELSKVPPPGPLELYRVLGYAQAQHQQLASTYRLAERIEGVIEEIKAARTKIKTLLPVLYRTAQWLSSLPFFATKLSESAQAAGAIALHVGNISKLIQEPKRQAPLDWPDLLKEACTLREEIITLLRNTQRTTGRLVEEELFSTEGEHRVEGLEPEGDEGEVEDD